MLSELISNPFKGISDREDKDERKQTAIKRALPWSLIQKIEEISFSKKKA